MEPGPARDAWDARLRLRRRDIRQTPTVTSENRVGMLPQRVERPVHRHKPPPIMPGTPIVISGATTSWTGYGQISEWLGRSLEDLGVEVVYRSTHHDPRYFDRSPFILERLDRISTSPWEIHLELPDADRPPSLGTISFTMWESSEIRPAGIDKLNQTAAVIVPCQWNKECLARQGVTVPIHVVPLGMNPKMYRPTVEPPFGWGSPIFRFGTSGRVSHGGTRKGLDEACQAFLRAFPSDAKMRLEVKVWPDCEFTPPDDWRIVVNREPMDPKQIGDWYRTLHCYLTATKGEGFGLQTLQAMAVGRPVIAAKATGTAEFFDAACGWEVEHDWVPASSYYEGLGSWPIPRESSLAEAMQAAVANRQACAAKGMAAAARALDFTWAHTGQKLKTVLGMIGCLVLPDNLTPGYAVSQAARDPAAFLAAIPDEAQQTAKSCQWRETVVRCCGPSEVCHKPNHPWHGWTLSMADCMLCVSQGWNRA